MVSERESDIKHFKEVPISCEDRAKLIVIELYDDVNAPNREPFSVSEIAQALREAEARGMERAAKIVDEFAQDARGGLPPSPAVVAIKIRAYAAKGCSND